MPALLGALLVWHIEAILVKSLHLFGRDDADFVVLAAQGSPAVDDGMNVEFRG